MVARNTRDAGFGHDVFGLAVHGLLAGGRAVGVWHLPLAAHGLYGLPWRADEGQAGFCAFPRKGWVLAQLQRLVSRGPRRVFPRGPYEAIARMYALAALLLCNLYDAISVEICRRPAEIDSIGRAQGMLRGRVWVGVEGRGAYAVL
jgi:hypothetical protein